MTSIFHANLSRDLSLILDDADDFDAIIQVGENQNTKEFKAHSVILRARSPYFRSALSTRWITRKNNMVLFSKPNITPTVFDMILKYIYAGELDLTTQLCEDILGLLVASDELLLEELFNHVQDYLIEEKQTWVKQNFVYVLHTVFKLSSCKKLQDICIESICTDPINSENLSLDKDILHELLKRDDTLIEEAIAWDYLVKWGIEQIPGLGGKNEDRAKWNHNDYETLKKALDRFIPLIRFVELSPEDFFDKVRPYKAIVPNKIYEEVEEFYFKGTLPKTVTLQPRTGKVVSRIIKPKLSRIIVNWIDEKEVGNIYTEKYKFKLIYRKSRDGNESSDTIRNRCADQGAILILIKVKYSDKIFGGYNPVGWHTVNQTSSSTTVNLLRSHPYFSIANPYSTYPTAVSQTPNDHYLTTNKSFIFSFENNEDTKNMKIGRVINPSYAIYDYPGTNGINFGGDLELGNDYLYLYNNGNYENLISTCRNARYGREYDEYDDEYDDYEDDYYGDEDYEVEEIEAFSVNKL